MKDYLEFRNWLDETTEFTKPTKSNIVSRLKRADSILPIAEDTVYIFNLCKMPEFMELSVSVKSQIRRAIKLYFQYKNIE